MTCIYHLCKVRFSLGMETLNIMLFATVNNVEMIF
ncbi:hypothetical protein HNR50_003194 [Spirochaeta isovalerica]|uniref:Uncharacterized protein n=1 Tax=Spirochaeta isovalerica TaxID=150 RepID=A0A841R8A5_9SPIO|nr:hypothetical protein [Spirochaeta isovalerica]